jgi:hypothetical protein
METKNSGGIVLESKSGKKSRRPKAKLDQYGAKRNCVGLFGEERKTATGVEGWHGQKEEVSALLLLLLRLVLAKRAEGGEG